MHRTHKHFHFFLISHLPAYLKRRSLVAPPPRPDHPRLMRKQLRRLLCPRSQRPGAVRLSDGEGEKKAKTHTDTHTPSASLPAFSSASASPSDLLLFSRTSSPLHRGCRLSLPLSLSPSSLQPPSFAPPISELWAALGLDGSLSQWLINTSIDPLAKCL